MKKICAYLIVFIILAMSVMRFIGLNNIPNGFTEDETSNATHILCMAQNGTNAQGKYFPLYSDQFEPEFQTTQGQVPPTHLYFGAIWSMLFGGSMQSFRAIGAFWIALATLGVFFFSRLFLSPISALLCTLSMALSPMAFCVSRFGLMVAFVPALIIWGCYFFLAANTFGNAILSGLCLVLALYSYPPQIVQIPLLIAGLLWVQWRLNKLNVKHIFIFFISFTLISIPFFIHTFTALSSRVDALFIFSSQFVHQHTLYGSIRIFFQNLWLYFSPDYLFFKGDNNLRHSTQFTGSLSWIDSLSLLSIFVLFIVDRLAKKRKFKFTISNQESVYIGFALLGVISGILPAALTWEGQPHTLRSVGMLPFLCVISGWVLGLLVKKWEKTLILATILSTVFAVMFVSDYFNNSRGYPVRSANSWQKNIKDSAEVLFKTGNWRLFLTISKSSWHMPKYSAQYFLMNYFRDDCTSSRMRVDEIYDENTKS